MSQERIEEAKKNSEFGQAQRVVYLRVAPSVLFTVWSSSLFKTKEFGII